MLQRDSLATGNVFKKPKYGSIIIGSRDSHHNVHLLILQVHLSVGGIGWIFEHMEEWTQKAVTMAEKQSGVIISATEVLVCSGALTVIHTVESGINTDTSPFYNIIFVPLDTHCIWAIFEDIE